MSILFLKIIALVFMTIDHIGLFLLNNNQIFRFLGRIAFPLYSFILVQGFIHVKDNKKKLTKYFVNLSIFAIITEPIYNYIMNNGLTYFQSQNILFSLLTYLFAMLIYEKNSKTITDKIVFLLLFFTICLLSEILFLNYGALGLCLTLGFYLIEKYNCLKNNKTVSYLILLLIYTSLAVLKWKYIEVGALLSIIPIILYNYEKGYSSKLLKYFFYIYYPLHLFILLLLKK